MKFAHHRLETNGKPSIKDLLAKLRTCGERIMPPKTEEGREMEGVPNVRASSYRNYEITADLPLPITEE